MPASGESRPTYAPAADPANDDLTCPLCGYSLRGLIDPRCPECGYAFDWAALRERALHQHPYLFERHPEKNLRSFFQTVLRGQFPVDFWETLKLWHDCFRRRLIFYWMIVALMPVLAIALEIGLLALPRATYPIYTRSHLSIPVGLPYGPAQGHPFSVPALDWPVTLDALTTWFHGVFQQDHYLVPVTCLALFGVAWPTVSLLALLIFRQTLRKARVKKVHLFRAVVYSVHSIFWVGLFCASFLAVWFAMGGMNDADITPVLLIAAGVAYVASVYKLTRAAQFYLKFPGCSAMVIVSQIIFFLAALDGFSIYDTSSDWARWLFL